MRPSTVEFLWTFAIFQRIYLNSGWGWFIGVCFCHLRDVPWIVLSVCACLPVNEAIYPSCVTNNYNHGSTIWLIDCKDTTYRVSHETWQLVNSLECLFPKFVKLFNIKDNNKNIIQESYYGKINFKVEYIWTKDFLNEINFKQPFVGHPVSEFLLGCVTSIPGGHPPN